MVVKYIKISWSFTKFVRLYCLMASLTIGENLPVLLERNFSSSVALALRSSQRILLLKSCAEIDLYLVMSESSAKSLWSRAGKTESGDDGTIE